MSSAVSFAARSESLVRMRVTESRRAMKYLYLRGSVSFSESGTTIVSFGETVAESDGAMESGNADESRAAGESDIESESVAEVSAIASESRTLTDPAAAVESILRMAVESCIARKCIALPASIPKDWTAASPTSRAGTSILPVHLTIEPANIQ